MLSLVVALALAGAPKPLTRTEIFKVMGQKPTAECGTGNPWLLFVDEEHARSTNKLLIAMIDDTSLTQDQRDDALFALRYQRDPTVMAFMRERFKKTAPDTWVHQRIGLSLMEYTPAEQELVMRELGTGSMRFDDALLNGLDNTPEGFTPTKGTIALVHAYRARATDSQRKARATRFLTRFDPGPIVSGVLRSGDSEEIDAVAAHLEGVDAQVDDLVEGLNAAASFGREQLDKQLGRELLQLIRTGKDDAALTALTAEWVGASPRRGLTRAPISAYVLGTHLMKRGEVERARRVLLAGSAANDRLLGEPSQFGPDYHLLGNGLVFRAALAQLALAANDLEAARRYGDGLTVELGGHQAARRVLEEFTVGPKIDVAALEKKLAR